MVREYGTIFQECWVFELEKSEWRLDYAINEFLACIIAGQSVLVRSCSKLLAIY